MTHEKRRKCSKKKPFICEFPRCPEARLALVGGAGGAGGTGRAPAPAAAAGSSRAQLINHVVEEFLPTGKEYTSFFRLSVTRDPSNMTLPPLKLPLTPPTRDSLTDARQSITDTYPSTLRTLRQLPTYVSTSIDSSDLPPLPEEKLKYTSRRGQCTTTECTPIPRYADHGTMTPKYKDASCGLSRSVRFNTCRRDSAVVASMTTLLEPGVHFEQFTTSPYEYPKRCEKYPNCGVQIDLQKEQFTTSPYEYPRRCEKYPNCGGRIDLQKDFELPCGEPRAVRDTDEQRGWSEPPCPEEPRGWPPSPCADEPRRGWTDVDHQGVTPILGRRMLYNEGITDSQAALLPTRRSPSCHARRDKSRESSRCYKIDGFIPYSHNSNSKYHQNCKEDYRRPYSAVVGEEHIVRSSTMIPCAEVRAPLGLCAARRPAGPRPASLPRKVLMSEKDIEAYINCSWRNKNKSYCD